MNQTIHFALATALLTTALPLSAAAKSLKDLVSMALEKSPQVQAAVADAQADEHFYRARVGTFFPSLDLKADHGWTKHAPQQSAAPQATDDNPWGSQLTLSLTENLYDNGVAWNGYETAKLQRQHAALTLEQTREAVSLAMHEAFYAYSRTQNLVETNSELLKTLTTQFRLTESQYRQGLKERKDFLRFRGELQRAEMQALELENNLGDARGKIATLTGAPAAELDIEVYRPQVKERVVVPAAPVNVEDTKTAKLADLQKQLDGFAVDLVAKKNRPEINLSAAATYGSSDYMGTAQPMYRNDGVQWGAMLSLQYNLWDFGVRRHELAVAVQRRTSSAWRREAELGDLGETLTALFGALTLGAKNLALVQELLQLEQESFDILASQYRQGRVGYVELVEGLKNLNSAKTGYFNSRFEFLSNVARYRFHEGSIDAVDAK